MTDTHVRDIPASDEEWRQRLTPEQYTVLRKHGTERAFTGPYLDAKDDGTYRCAGCGNPLFDSSVKFESGTGWPSFSAPFDPEHVREIDDTSLGMTRTEVRCARCDSHLGHVFPDGPSPTFQRYCLNAVAMEFYDSAGAIPDRLGTART